MLELKQIDDNTYSINGKIFKHTGEDVLSPLEQNIKDEVRYTVEYCKGKKIAVHCPLMSLYLDVDDVLIRNGYPKTEHLESMYGNNRRETAIYFDAVITIGNVEDLSSRGYKIITSTQFIAHNTPQQDEVQYPWQKEWEILDYTGPFKANIHSIKRLSDNAKFTVGDTIERNGKTATIESISISDNKGTFFAHQAKDYFNLSCYNPYITLSEDSKFEVALLELVKCMTDDEDAQNTLYDKFKSVLEAHKTNAI